MTSAGGGNDFLEGREGFDCLVGRGAHRCGSANEILVGAGTPASGGQGDDEITAAARVTVSEAEMVTTAAS